MSAVSSKSATEMTLQQGLGQVVVDVGVDAQQDVPQVGQVGWGVEGSRHGRGTGASARSAGLPGGAAEIALFQYARDGLLLDRLTVSIDPDTETDEG